MGKKHTLETTMIYQVAVPINIEVLQEEGWEQLKKTQDFENKNNNIYLKY